MPVLIRIVLLLGLLLPGAAGEWVLTAPMLAPRVTGFSTTMLPNGRVLVIGGQDDRGRLLASAEVYDPIADRWLPDGALMAPRAGHTATLIDGGYVLVVGGRQSGSVNATATAERFDVVFGVSEPMPGLTVARSGHTAHLLADGRLLVVGGQVMPAIAALGSELWHPVTGTWSTTLGFLPRFSHASVVDQLGRVVVAGGRITGGDLLAAVQAFDPVSNRWSFLRPMPNPRSSPQLVAVPDGPLVLSGFFSERFGGSTLALYESARNAWRVGESAPASLPGHSATLMPDRTIIYVSGRFGSHLAMDDEYADGLFRTRHSRLHHSRFGHDAIALENGNLLVIGGAGGAPGTAERWDHTRNAVPVARAGPDQVVECGEDIVLNGGASSDADGSAWDPELPPLQHLWMLPDGRTLTGAIIRIRLPVGIHRVVLRVDDGQATDDDVVEIRVVDTRPPTFTTSVVMVMLTPDDRLIDVGYRLRDVSDCSAIRARLLIASDEPSCRFLGDPRSPDAVITTVDGLPAGLALRAEADPRGDGRVYLITTDLIDAHSNAATRRVIVLVPRSRSFRDRLSVVIQGLSTLFGNRAAPHDATDVCPVQFPG